ncbi:hypothetical protein CsatB_017668 [Cannabis sativa]
MHSRNWDVKVVRDLFSLVDAATILGIPINQSAEGDYWYWFGEKDGSYSVRSAYKMIQDNKFPPSNSDDNVFWKKMWSFKVPPKVKDLLWRAASNCLATKVNLCIKKVLTDNVCPMCGIYVETEFHLLVTCQFAGSCWEEAAVAEASRNNTSLLQWLTFKAKPNCHAVLGLMLKVKETFLYCHPSKMVMVRSFGKKPRTGIKLNVDAAIFDRESKHGFGCVVRNSGGELVSAFAGVKFGKVSPELAEIIGIREVLS